MIFTIHFRFVKVDGIFCSIEFLWEVDGQELNGTCAINGGWQQVAMVWFWSKNGTCAINGGWK